MKVGYAMVSTKDQNESLNPQREALEDAGWPACSRTF